MDLEQGGFCVFEKCNWNMHTEADEGHKIPQLGWVVALLRREFDTFWVWDFVIVRAVYLALWLTVEVDILQTQVLCTNLSIPAVEITL